MFSLSISKLKSSRRRNREKNNSNARPIPRLSMEATSPPPTIKSSVRQTLALSPKSPKSATIQAKSWINHKWSWCNCLQKRKFLRRILVSSGWTACSRRKLRYTLRILRIKINRSSSLPKYTRTNGNRVYSTQLQSMRKQDSTSINKQLLQQACQVKRRICKTRQVTSDLSSRTLRLQVALISIICLWLAPRGPLLGPGMGVGWRRSLLCRQARSICLTQRSRTNRSSTITRQSRSSGTPRNPGTLIRWLRLHLNNRRTILWCKLWIILSHAPPIPPATITNHKWPTSKPACSVLQVA